MKGDALAVLEHHSKSFALAARLLPEERRQDAAVLYAWCRYADDLIDLGRSDEAPALARRLEHELDSVYAGDVQANPLLSAFQQVVRARGIPREYPAELLRGMRMDAEGFRYRSLDDLLLYCHRVAGVVGLMMCHVLGVSDPRALRHAAHLGMGMQLTNIVRDVREDRGRGRVYLPAELGSASEARAAERLLREADRFYDSGRRGLSALDARSAFAVRTAGLVYAAIGREIRRRRFDLGSRAVVPRWKKLLLCARAALSSLLELPRRLLTPRAPLRALPIARYPDDVLPI
ncbi:MAG: phytoene/squalene synthase family protein [Polyangiaceae bacterium]|nr:phytoene/squalene synthase family protein [Polyangiaceae bacterium]MCL4752906.1 phytoene/squalene synthase family protein [Myxococcales bacterium]